MVPVRTDRPARLVLCDDDYFVREGVRAILSANGYEIVAAVGDVASLMEAIAAEHPDAALVDIRMPPTWTTEGLEAARSIRAEFPDTGVVVLSQYLFSGYARSLLSASREGVGYVIKGDVDRAAPLCDAVDAVVAGSTYVDPGLITRLTQRIQWAAKVESLSHREFQILELIAAGYSNASIATRLKLSGRTVDSYITSLLHKLEVPKDLASNRRVQAVLRFLEAATLDAIPEVELQGR